ncbi:MAG: hypothetical protein HOA49_02540 [Flavobacteriales bacterium]|jgi:hypothetical protein|nr:hypothetical protein [Flavobacteriales bacterium]MBT5354105.1 hypothetical protein [Flavobacteriales bacterium]MBT5698807.1 hypothetical protein [Flavobacteriales bacterium]MBT6815266.1 hypothetical protein [Flavobacteriales bacterium]MBT7620751.1 hypothetical protein [Flavobacteriales bacterium]
MLRRLMFFGVGALISIIVLSIGNNRVRDTFVSYLHYGDDTPRVISQLKFADYKIYRDSDTLDFEEVDVLISVSEELSPRNKRHKDSSRFIVESFLKNAWVNRDMSDRDSYPQIFVLDNVVGSQNQRLYCRYYKKDKTVIEETRFDPIKEDSVTERKKVSIVDYVKLEKDIPISSRSYISYLIIIGIFLLIMIPVSFFCRRLIRKIGLKDE